jgi:hypothetical protein
VISHLEEVEAARWTPAARSAWDTTRCAWLGGLNVSAR